MYDPPMPEIATKEDAEAFIAKAMGDEVTWKAAAILLGRVKRDRSYRRLDAETRAAVERFLERHPAPTE